MLNPLARVAGVYPQSLHGEQGTAWPPLPVAAPALPEVLEPVGRGGAVVPGRGRAAWPAQGGCSTGPSEEPW